MLAESAQSSSGNIRRLAQTQTQRNLKRKPVRATLGEESGPPTGRLHRAKHSRSTAAPVGTRTHRRDRPPLGHKATVNNCGARGGEPPVPGFVPWCGLIGDELGLSTCEGTVRLWRAREGNIVRVRNLGRYGGSIGSCALPRAPQGTTTGGKMFTELVLGKKRTEGHRIPGN